MRSNDSVNLEESLGVLAGLEPAHSLLALTGGLMRVLRAVVQVAVLSMSNAPGITARFVVRKSRRAPAWAT